MARPQVHRARYTKENGDVSDRVLIGPLHSVVTVIDATALPDADRDELARLHAEYLDGLPSFKAWLEERGHSTLAAQLAWKSFKRSGLSDVAPL